MRAQYIRLYEEVLLGELPAGAAVAVAAAAAAAAAGGSDGAEASQAAVAAVGGGGSDDDEGLGAGGPDGALPPQWCACGGPVSEDGACEVRPAAVRCPPACPLARPRVCEMCVPALLSSRSAP